MQCIFWDVICPKTFLLSRWVNSSYSLSGCFHRDRFRTTVNVLGDSIGAGVVEHLSRDDLRKYDCNGIVDDRAPLSKQDKDPDQVVVTSAL